MVNALFRRGYLLLHVHSFPLLQGPTWIKHCSSICYWTTREKTRNESHCSEQWHSARCEDLPLGYLLKPSYTLPKQPSVSQLMVPEENKENHMSHNKSTPLMHEPEERELLSLQAWWIYGLWVSDLTLDTCTVMHCHGIYSPLPQPWIGTAVLTQITGKYNIGTGNII